MKSIEILKQEHRVIEIVLTCIEKMADRAQADGRLDRERAELAVDFIRNFADRCHHGKEENHLFAAMIDHGFPRDRGPVGAMLHEHDEGRALVRGMADNIEAGEAGDRDAIDGFVDNALGYVMMLRAHIKKEDSILYPLAGQVLDSSVMDSLADSFEIVERDHMGEGTHDRYLGIAAALADYYGVNHDVLTGMSHKCSHHTPGR